MYINPTVCDHSDSVAVYLPWSKLITKTSSFCHFNYFSRKWPNVTLKTLENSCLCLNENYMHIHTQTQHDILKYDQNNKLLYLSNPSYSFYWLSSNSPLKSEKEIPAHFKGISSSLSRGLLLPWFLCSNITLNHTNDCTVIKSSICSNPVSDPGIQHIEDFLLLHSPHFINM